MLDVLEHPRTSFQVSTSQFIVESGIPLPPRTYGRGRDYKYPFPHMQAGDSFEVPLASYTPRSGRSTLKKLQTSLANVARGYASRNNPSAKFAIRKTSDTTVRVWRIA